MLPLLNITLSSTYGTDFETLLPILDDIGSPHYQLNHYTLELLETNDAIPIFIYIVDYLPPVSLLCLGLCDGIQHLVQLVSRYKPGLVQVKHTESLLKTLVSQKLLFVGSGKGPL
jgi:hypothetical protein